jgi:hypothetical protein
MGVLVGIVVSAAITVAVSRYYFRRSLLKRLGAYVILSSAVFAGIDAEVRKQLRFTFKDKDVSKLQLLQIVLVNEGEHAIRDFIEPPTLVLPKGAEVLDASVIHREPSTLVAELRTRSTQENEEIIFDFALLNKREFFICKLLVSGSARMPLTARMQCDDLPRALELQYLSPFTATEGGKSKSGDLLGLLGALVFSGFVFALGYLFYFVYSVRPDFFPYPWHSFKPSKEGAAFLVSLPIEIILAIIAIAVIGAICGSLFSRGPSFTIPKGFGRSNFSGRFYGVGDPYIRFDDEE